MGQLTKTNNDRKVAFVLGNGLSRLQFDISQLSKHGTVIGCNRIYDHLIPDYIVSVDKPMIDIILMDDVQMKTKVFIDGRVYRQHYKHCKSLYPIDADVNGIIGSGDLACMLACVLEHTHVYMIGFDYISKNDKINNVYTGRKPYKPIGSTHTLPISIQNWYNKFEIVINRYPDVQFIRVNANNFIPPVTATNFTNCDGEHFNKLFQGVYV